MSTHQHPPLQHTLSFAARSSLKALLESTLVSSLPAPSGPIITVTSHESVIQGFQKLSTHNILSAPVFDLSTNTFTGFLDVKDLVSFVVFLDLEKSLGLPTSVDEVVNTVGPAFFGIPIEGITVTYLSRRNPFKSVSPNDSLLKVCQLLSSKTVQRVPVVEHGKLVNIISQSTIIQFLQKHAELLKADLAKTIADAQIGTSPVITVNVATPAIKTFQLLDSKKLSGIAVVDDVGRLVSAISGSDLKIFIQDFALDALKLPTLEFLQRLRTRSSPIEGNPTISLSPHDSVNIAIAKLAATRVHRLFVADDAHGYKPERIVSITDVIKYIIS